MRYTAETRVLRVNPDDPEPDIIRQAADVIRAGGLVAFPTETVYGLGANATDASAVERIFSAKERPFADPLIVHLATVEQLPTVALDLPQIARELTALMPGPLTLILKRHPAIPPNVSAELDTVAVRVPSHPVAHALIAAAGVPVAAPSANRFSRPSATTAAHVLEDLRGHVNLILDGGAAPIGIESTIVDVTSDPPRILRYGAITPEQFESLGFIVEAPAEVSSDEGAKPAPGMMLKHYSPRARLRFYSDDSLDAMIRQMRDDATELATRGQRVGILATEPEAPYVDDLPAQIVTLGIGLDQIAARLFAAMRELDNQGVDVILAHDYGHSGIGAALYERLLRAAEGKVIHLTQNQTGQA